MVHNLVPSTLVSNVQELRNSSPGAEGPMTVANSRPPLLPEWYQTWVDNVLSSSSEHLGLLKTKRDLDGPRRGTETLKTRLDMFKFEENVQSMLQEQTHTTPTPSTKSFCWYRYEYCQL